MKKSFFMRQLLCDGCVTVVDHCDAFVDHCITFVDYFMLSCTIVLLS